MRFVILHEAGGPEGVAGSPSRYKETITEARRAEEVGFSCVAVSEQHFNTSDSTISAPEALLGALAILTDTIRLRFASVVLLPFNHPIRVAERVATLDILSEGRIEVGTARSNNPGTLAAFGVDPKKTRAYWSESFSILKKALTEPILEHHGEEWDIPATPVIPRPVQTPCPPLYVSATSMETHRVAGTEGVAVMTGNSLPGGWDYMAKAMAVYAEGRSSMPPGHNVITDSRGALALVAHCAESSEEAQEEAAEHAASFVDMVAGWYERLAASSDDYAELGPLREVVDRRHDLEFLIDRSPYLSIGTPDFFLERCQRLHDLGYDEFILRIDGINHGAHMRTIELLGEHVIPEFS